MVLSVHGQRADPVCGGRRQSLGPCGREVLHLWTGGEEREAGHIKVEDFTCPGDCLRRQTRTLTPSDTRRRSSLKALSYRVLGSSTTLLIVLTLIGRIRLSVGAGLLDAVAKVGAYFVHERVWDRIGFGRDCRAAEGRLVDETRDGNRTPVT